MNSSPNVNAQPRLLTERAGRVLTVRFNNPPHHFYDEQMSIELDDLTRRLKRDKSVGAVVFTGQDSGYTHLYMPDLMKGALLTPFGIPYGPSRLLMFAASLAGRSRIADRLLRKTPASPVATLVRTTNALKRMNEMGTVFVAALNGSAIAFGCVIALACDIRLMAQGDYVFAVPEAEVAMLAGAGGTQRLVRMIGTSRAAELLFEGRMLTPDAAHQMGLVHRLVPSPDLQHEAAGTAEYLASRPSSFNREIKRALYTAGTRSLAAGIRMEAASMMTIVSARGIAASIKRLQDELDNSTTTETGELIRTVWTKAGEAARRALSDT